MAQENYRSSQDNKLRFGGLLENPTISNIQRGILDAGRVKGLKAALNPLSYSTVLDVGCGLGEGSAVSKGSYTGIDNSFPRILYASKQYKSCRFLSGDAMTLPFKDNSYDLVMMVDTSHHLSDAEFHIAMIELARISKNYVVVSDPVTWQEQPKISRYFYSLDRGGSFRSSSQMKEILESTAGYKLVDEIAYKTFPGLYLHTAFILQKM